MFAKFFDYLIMVAVSIVLVLFAGGVMIAIIAGIVVVILIYKGLVYVFSEEENPSETEQQEEAKRLEK